MAQMTVREVLGGVTSALRRLDASSRRAWLVLVPVMLAVTVMEAICASTVVTLLQALSGHPVTLMGMRAFSQDDPHWAAWACAGAALLYITRGLLRLTEALLRQRAACGSGRHLSVYLLRGYLNAPMGWHLKRHTGELLHRVSNATSDLARVLMTSAAGFLVEGLSVLTVALILARSSPTVVLGVLAILVLMVLLLLRPTLRKHRELGLTHFTLQVAIAKRLEEAFGSLKEIQIMGLQDRPAREVEKDWRELAELQARRGTLEAVPRNLIETVFLAGSLASAGLALHSGVPLTTIVPVLGICLYAGARLLASIHLLVYYASEISFHVEGLMRLERDWQNLDSMGVLAGDTAPSPAPSRLEREIELQEVTFQYPGRSMPALAAASFVIRRGESVGIMGSSGAGKSTLVDLLLGVLTPVSGRILVDGHVIGQGPLLRPGRIGYVPHSAFLYEGSLLDNIVLAHPDRMVDERRVRECLRMAQLEPLLAQLPQGLESPIGERGLSLSAGQRQRVALARALYIEPEILVLDEATAALDTRTEDDLLHTLESLPVPLTRVIVSHRMSTVSRCDKVLVLEAGRIVALKAPAELVSSSSTFRESVPSAA